MNFFHHKYIIETLVSILGKSCIFKICCSVFLLIKIIWRITCSENRSLSTIYSCNRIFVLYSIYVRIFTGICRTLYVKSMYGYVGRIKSYYFVNRISKACMLINSTELSIAEIATQVGLEPGGFARMFKREMGVTPGKYRKKLIKGE